jgi:hypothetical protein
MKNREFLTKSLGEDKLGRLIMRRIMLRTAVTLVVLFTFDIAAAQAQEQQKDGNDSNEQAVKRVIRRTPAGRLKASPEVNVLTAEEREKMILKRRQARNKMRQQDMEHSFTAMRDMNKPGDANAPAFRARGKPRDINEAVARGPQLRQRMTAIEQQITNEEAKHCERIARLGRIRELAQQQGDAEMVTKTDKVLEEEKQRYEMITQRMEQRKERVTDALNKAAQDANKKLADVEPNK